MLTAPGWLGLPRDIWLIIASALLMCSALLAQRVPDLRAAVARGRAGRRRARRWLARIDFTSMSDDAWLAELARMRTERSGQLGSVLDGPTGDGSADLAELRRQLGPAQGRDWDPPGAELGAWLNTEQLWPGDPRRPPA